MAATSLSTVMDIDLPLWEKQDTGERKGKDYANHK